MRGDRTFLLLFSNPRLASLLHITDINRTEKTLKSSQYLTVKLAKEVTSSSYKNGFVRGKSCLTNPLHCHEEWGTLLRTIKELKSFFLTSPKRSTWFHNTTFCRNYRAWDWVGHLLTASETTLLVAQFGLK